MLSGMSPGGLLSAATGACWAALGGPPVATLADAADPCAAGVSAVGVPAVGVPAVGLPELQPVTSTTSTAVTVYGLDRLMPVTLDRRRPASGQRKVKAHFAFTGPTVQVMTRPRNR